MIDLGERGILNEFNDIRDGRGIELLNPRLPSPPQIEAGGAAAGSLSCARIWSMLVLWVPSRRTDWMTADPIASQSVQCKDDLHL